MNIRQERLAIGAVLVVVIVVSIVGADHVRSGDPGFAGGMAITLLAGLGLYLICSARRRH